jgi:hypothetical protein
MKKGDFFILLFIAVIIGASLLGAYLLRISGDVKHVVIEVDRKVLYDIPLQKGMKPREIKVDTGDGGYNIVSIGSDGTVDVTEANCRDQICVQWGVIRNPGETIVCLPHRMTVKITGGKDAGDVDEIAS